jgi:hypothetical protein
MLYIKKSEEVKNGQAIEEDGEVKKYTAGEPATLFEKKATQTSERKREANRRNANRSTGPKMQRGKNTSRLNSLKHGLTARAIPLRNVPLANIAVADDYADWLLTRRGAVGREAELEF